MNTVKCRKCPDSFRTPYTIKGRDGSLKFKFAMRCGIDGYYCCKNLSHCPKDKRK